MFIVPLPTFPENFMQICSEVLRKVDNRQTNKQQRLHIFLGGGNNPTYRAPERRKNGHELSVLE